MNLQKPFTKIIDVSAGTVSSLTFRDSEGTSLKCNYVAVVPMGSTADGEFLVRFDALAANVPSVDRTDADTSGFLGLAGGAELGTVTSSTQIHLGNQRVTQCQLENVGANTLSLAVTYGLDTDSDDEGWRGSMEILGN